MINGIKPNPMMGDFDKAMNKLVENIHINYERWSNNLKVKELT